MVATFEFQGTAVQMVYVVGMQHSLAWRINFFLIVQVEYFYKHLSCSSYALQHALFSPTSQRGPPSKYVQ